MLSEKDTLDTLEDENLSTFEKNTTQILKLTQFLPDDNTKFSNLVSLYLIKIIYNDSLQLDYKNKLKKQKNSVFTSKFTPKISIGDFVNKIIKFTKTSETTFILGLIYINRFCKIKDIILTDYNTHRIFLTSILLAKKYNEDNFYSNKFFSKVCGIKLKDLNVMEYNFLIDISFDLYVKNTIVKHFQEKILNQKNII